MKILKILFDKHDNSNYQLAIASLEKVNELLTEHKAKQIISRFTEVSM